MVSRDDLAMELEDLWVSCATCECIVLRWARECECLELSSLSEHNVGSAEGATTATLETFRSEASRIRRMLRVVCVQVEKCCGRVKDVPYISAEPFSAPRPPSEAAGATPDECFRDLLHSTTWKYSLSHLAQRASWLQGCVEQVVRAISREGTTLRNVATEATYLTIAAQEAASAIGRNLDNPPDHIILWEEPQRLANQQRCMAKGYVPSAVGVFGCTDGGDRHKRFAHLPLTSRKLDDVVWLKETLELRFVPGLYCPTILRRMLVEVVNLLEVVPPGPASVVVVGVLGHNDMASVRMCIEEQTAESCRSPYTVSLLSELCVSPPISGPGQRLIVVLNAELGWNPRDVAAVVHHWRNADREKRVCVLTARNDPRSVRLYDAFAGGL